MRGLLSAGLAVTALYGVSKAVRAVVSSTREPGKIELSEDDDDPAAEARTILEQILNYPEGGSYDQADELSDYARPHAAGVYNVYIFEKMVRTSTKSANQTLANVIPSAVRCLMRALL